jgi:hypothetical protein
MISGDFDVFDSALAIVGDPIHVGFRFPVRLERVVMAVNQQGSAGEQAGIHTHVLAAVHPDQHEASPVGSGAFWGRSLRAVRD